MNQEKFIRACDLVISEGMVREQIGNLNEKLIHKVLKYYYNDNKDCHEVKVKNYYADIKNGDDITEIQTHNFYQIKNKLKDLLLDYQVNLVHPLYLEKISVLLNSTGQVIKKRKSSHKENLFSMAMELFYIKDLLNNPKLKITIPYLKVEEYKYEGKKEKLVIPVDIIKEEELDLCNFLFEKLEFTLKEYSEFFKINKRLAQTVLYILLDVGLIKRARKVGNAYIYEVIKNR